MADNLEKDAASTRERFESIVSEACGAGWLDSSFQEGYLGSHAAANGGSLPTPETQACAPYCSFGIFPIVAHPASKRRWSS